MPSEREKEREQNEIKSIGPIANPLSSVIHCTLSSLIAPLITYSVLAHCLAVQAVSSLNRFVAGQIVFKFVSVDSTRMKTTTTRKRSKTARAGARKAALAVCPGTTLLILS